MATKIIISASDVWDYFQKSKADLETHMHQIASNTEYGIDVYVTENCGLPNIVVTADDVQILEETILNKDECKQTVERVYDDYLTTKVIETLSELEDDDYNAYEPDIDDLINEREAELDSATYDFIMNALQWSYYDNHEADINDVIEDCKEHFLEYMARKHGLPVYRPMILEYDDGTEDMSEYPYDDIEFDDPDNPLYKRG